MELEAAALNTKIFYQTSTYTELDIEKLLNTCESIRWAGGTARGGCWNIRYTVEKREFPESESMCRFAVSRVFAPVSR